LIGPPHYYDAWEGLGGHKVGLSHIFFVKPQHSQSMRLGIGPGSSMIARELVGLAIIRLRILGSRLIALSGSLLSLGKIEHAE
jgi:hypothetical protein